MIRASPWKAALRATLNTQNPDVDHAIPVSDLDAADELDVIRVLFPDKTAVIPPDPAYYPALATRIVELYYTYRTLDLMHAVAVEPASLKSKLPTTNKRTTFAGFLRAHNTRPVYHLLAFIATRWAWLQNNYFVPFRELDVLFWKVRGLDSRFERADAVNNVATLFTEMNDIVTFYNTYLFPVTTCIQYDTVQISGSCWINASLNALLLSERIAATLKRKFGGASPDPGPGEGAICPLFVEDDPLFRQHVVAIIQRVFQGKVNPNVDYYKPISQSMTGFDEGGIECVAFYNIVHVLFQPNEYDMYGVAIDGRTRVLSALEFTRFKDGKVEMSPTLGASIQERPPKAGILAIMYMGYTAPTPASPTFPASPTLLGGVYRLESMVYRPKLTHASTVFTCGTAFLEFDSNNHVRQVRALPSPQVAVYLRTT